MNIPITGERKDIVWNSYGIPKKFINARFDNFYPQNNEQKKAINKCKTYSEQDIKSIISGKGLFLHCPITGTGKTHLAVSTVYAIIASNNDKFGYKCKVSEFMMLEELEASRQYSGLYVGFVNVTDLLTTLQESYSGDERFKQRAVNMLHRAKIDDLLILDDLGAMKPTEWVETQLYNLIDIRYRMERPMIFTSNCTMDDLEKQVGKRVVSRIFEVTDGIYVPGPDYRKRKLA